MVDPCPAPTRIMSTERRRAAHLESGEIAAYLDRVLPRPDRSRIEAHLAQCEECRDELVAVARLLRARPRQPGWYLPVGVAAAAAAVALFIIWPRPPEQPGSPEYREPAVTTTVPPAILGPRGVVAAPLIFVWTTVPHADRYRLALFDDSGRVVWETQTSDTAAALPDSIRLLPGASYLWKVEAQTGWDRWVASDLVGFSFGPARP